MPWYKMPFSYSKRILKKMLLGKDVHILHEQWIAAQNAKAEKLARAFYVKNVNHTNPIHNKKELMKVCGDENFDAYIVGSDQVWRKKMSSWMGLDTYFLDFVKQGNVRRVAYAVSLGTEEMDVSLQSSSRLAALYKKFDAVSVRESSALRAFHEYGWDMPKAVHVLDPTLLLDADKYAQIAQEAGQPGLTTGKIFCYVLDWTKRIEDVIGEKSAQGSNSIIVGLKDTATVSIAQWLDNIHNCDSVITDSYHGVVFSIIFNKQFVFTGNLRRGNARVTSLLKMLGLQEKSGRYDWNAVNGRIRELREFSLSFLKHGLGL